MIVLIRVYYYSQPDVLINGTITSGAAPWALFCLMGGIIDFMEEGVLVWELVARMLRLVEVVPEPELLSKELGHNFGLGMYHQF